MLFFGGPLDQLEEDGAEVDIEEFSSLDITAVRTRVATGVRGPRRSLGE